VQDDDADRRLRGELAGPGMLVPAPVAAAGMVRQHIGYGVAAVFPQNWQTNVRPGDDVEMVLNPYPGCLFFGKVDFVIPATGGGQFTTSGTIPNAEKLDARKSSRHYLS
jgi:membrane fusion protein, multidrug efflux system